MEARAPTAEPAPAGVLMSRVFDAPRDLMFRIWTEPEHLLRWWAPHDYTVPHAAFDARPGGRLRIDFRAPDGFTFANYGDVKEVVPPERLVFTTEYREDGKLLVVSLVTATFAEEGARRTRVTIKSDVTFAEPEAAPSLAGMEEGWNQQVDKLELYAAHAAAGEPGTLAVVVPAGRPVLLMRRAFAAQRPLVWSCFTTPDRIARWLGPDGYVNSVPVFDPRPGGSYRIEQASGGEVLTGDFLEIVEPERLVDTVEVEGSGAAASTGTHIFEAIDGGTLMTAIFRFDSVAERDAAVAAGMAPGSAQSYDRLACFLAVIDKDNPA